MVKELEFTLGQSLRSDSETYYRYVQELGHGKNASTILVIPSSGSNRGVLFALKIFQRILDDESRRRFFRETAFLRTCTHPAIMRTYDSGAYETTHGTYPFLVAEYLPHRLHDVMRSDTASLPEKLAYTLQLLSALDYLAHQQPPI